MSQSTTVSGKLTNNNLGGPYDTIKFGRQFWTNKKIWEIKLTKKNKISSGHFKKKLLKYYLEKENDIKINEMNIESFLRKKLCHMNFFNLLLYKIFSVSLTNIKYKPVFAFYNITNLTGIIISLIFFIKGLRRIFKYQPNITKLVKMGQLTSF